MYGSVGGNNDVTCCFLLSDNIFREKNLNIEHLIFVCISCHARYMHVLKTKQMVCGDINAYFLLFRPSGSLIASVQTLPDKQQVIFFEKNGLRHGEFLLPCKETKVVNNKRWLCLFGYTEPAMGIFLILCVVTMKKKRDHRTLSIG